MGELGKAGLRYGEKTNIQGTREIGRNVESSAETESCLELNGELEATGFVRRAA